MSVKVVDASVVAAIAFGEPRAEEAASIVSDAKLVAPALLRFELCSVAWKKARRHPENARLVAAGFRLALELEIDYVDVDHEAVLDLALKKGLTTYDACYLWLARTLKAPLTTFDERLRSAV